MQQDETLFTHQIYHDLRSSLVEASEVHKEALRYVETGQGEELFIALKELFDRQTLPKKNYPILAKLSPFYSSSTFLLDVINRWNEILGLTATGCELRRILCHDLYYLPLDCVIPIIDKCDVNNEAANVRLWREMAYTYAYCGLGEGDRAREVMRRNLTSPIGWGFNILCLRTLSRKELTNFQGHSYNQIHTTWRELLVEDPDELVSEDNLAKYKSILRELLLNPELHLYYTADLVSLIYKTQINEAQAVWRQSVKQSLVLSNDKKNQLFSLSPNRNLKEWFEAVADVVCDISRVEKSLLLSGLNHKNTKHFEN